MKTIALIDDHPLLAQGVADALEFAGVAAAVMVNLTTEDPEAELMALAPDLCLVDLNLGADDTGGMRFARAAAGAGIPFAMLTGSIDEVALGRCIEAGALGVIAKMDEFSQVMHQIDTVLHGGKCNPDSTLLEWVLASHRHDAEEERLLKPFRRLSEREAFVLQQIIDGRRVDDIAEVSFVSVATVRSQVRSILTKLGVQSQLAAVAAARKAGWECDLVS